MSIDVNAKTIGELALELPNAIAVMEQRHIDYCCRGGRTIAQACQDSGIEVSELMAAIGEPRPDGASDWDQRTLTDLQQYIVSSHHTYTRQALDTVTLLAEKVANRHGSRHAEVMTVRQLVFELVNDLLPHMMKEEQVLFPYIEGLEAGEPADSCFGTVANPIRAMMFEHEVAGEKLAELRKATSNYALPPDACLSFRALYERLSDLEKDLHQHIHLENNLLFPRAVKLEETVIATGVLARAR